MKTWTSKLGQSCDILRYWAREGPVGLNLTSLLARSVIVCCRSGYTHWHCIVHTLTALAGTFAPSSNFRTSSVGCIAGKCSINWALSAHALTQRTSRACASRMRTGSWRRRDGLGARGAEVFYVNLGFLKPLQRKTRILGKFYSIGGFPGVWQFGAKCDNWFLFKLFEKSLNLLSLNRNANGRLCSINWALECAQFIEHFPAMRPTEFMK